MSYTVLARRYRSRDFDEVVGQEPISRTLQNAIETQRTAHAYLFCGTRGVGKTTMARIFAMALNADEELSQRQEIADAILRGDDLDVIEIDGASNRGVQEARDLIASAGLAPARCPWRIYIIDEVHMLTREAFNALLKTMEEPPPHVKFILCTTEPHRVPATIQSRCQRFDFRPIPVTLIAGQLRAILAHEKVEADDDVIALVARLGDGSMRDALSVLDRLLAGGEERLTMGGTEAMLGLPPQELIDAIIEAILQEDGGAALEATAAMLRQGATNDQILEGMIDAFHSILIIVTCGDKSDLLDVSEEVRRVAVERAPHMDASGLLYMIALCESTMRHMRLTGSARALLDATVVRLCTAQRLADIPGMLQGNVPKLKKKGQRSVPPSRRDSSNSRPAPRESSQKQSVEAAPETQEQPPSEPPVSPPKPESGAQDKEPELTLDADAIWDRAHAQAADSASDQALLDQLVVTGCDGQTLSVKLIDGGKGTARIVQGRMDALAALIHTAAGRRLAVSLTVPEAATPSPTPDDQENAVDPLVRKVQDLFDATIIARQPTPTSKKEAP